MAENTITSIGRVEAQAVQAAAVQQSQSAYQPSSTPTISKKAVETGVRTPPSEETKQRLSRISPGIGHDTALRFDVNTETSDVTILIVERKSGKVINTIPAEAIKDIPVGELLEYSI